MRKASMLMILMFVLVACSHYSGPKDFLKDPHFAAYKTERDALEVQYLNKDISYADYVKQRDELDSKYDREVEKRDKIINY